MKRVLQKLHWVVVGYPVVVLRVWEVIFTTGSRHEVPKAQCEQQWKILTNLLVAMLVYGVHRETHCWVRWIDGSCLLKLLKCHEDDSVATARNKYRYRQTSLILQILCNSVFLFHLRLSSSYTPVRYFSSSTIHP
jgi:hypothetical protein